MKKSLPFLALLLTSIGSSAFASEPASQEIPAQSEPAKTLDIPKISKAFGHLLGQNIQSLGLEFDMPMLVQGIQDFAKGIEAPMTESECIQAISLIQENAFKTQCADNLKKAENFLSENKSKAGVVEIEPGKLQYIQLSAGTGDVVQPHNSPLIHYEGKFLDNKVFGKSTEPEIIFLDDTIQGFSKSIVGMKEGEKRRVFIHPDYGYGTAGFLPPNSLLTFDIEVVKANEESKEETSVSLSHDLNIHDHEIASIDEMESGVR